MSTPTPDDGNQAPLAGQQPDTPWPQYGQQAAPEQYESAYGQQAAPVAYAPPRLPSRAPGVLCIVLGLVLMIILAPVVFFSTAVSSISDEITNAAAGVQRLSNGGGVTLESQDGYFLQVVPPDTATACALTDSGGQSHAMQKQDSAGSAFAAEGLQPGSYTVECAGVSDTATFVGVPFSGEILQNTARNSLIWSTVVGVVGVGVLILGIVLVVRTNKRRRSIQVDIMMSGIQRQ
ncbi:hypothetical protein EHS14_03355 [Schaalia georgiae]|nr:hypothetical protein EHS14_03355 [Schaalia georgiae]